MAEKQRAFEPADRRARLAVVLLWTYVVVSGLFAVGLIGAVAAGVHVYAEEPYLDEDSTLATALLLAWGLVAVVYLAVIISCIVAFLVWLFRARANLPGLGIADARRSAGWAVAWW
jgi:hypothetical protein